MPDEAMLKLSSPSSDVELGVVGRFARLPSLPVVIPF
jgi:hypothetical protein